MSKIIWKPGTFIYPLPVVMVSCGNMEKSNIITVAWTGIINSEKPMCYISVRKERYSHNIIKNSKEFVINLTNEKLVYATDWCGVKTGSKVDKFKEMKLTKEKAKHVKCPIIKESPISLECKVKEIRALGTHDMFIAEIVSIDVEEQYIDKNGSFDIQLCNLITYANGKYFALGKPLGKFGYSVQKNKKGIIKINQKNKQIQKENQKQNARHNQMNKRKPLKIKEEKKNEFNKRKSKNKKNK